MKRPDKWDKKAEQMWTIIKANFNAEHPWGVRPNSLTLIARALRRTNAAAEKRGIAIGFKRSCVVHTGGKFNA